MADQNFEYLKPYISGTQFTLSQITGDTQIKEGTPRILKKGDKLGVDISGTVNMVCNKFEGALAVAFPAATYVKIVSKMLMEEYTTLTPDIEDAAGEITNMIFGHSKKVLEQNGFKLDKAIPTVVRGEDHSLSFQTTAPVMVVPFTSALGPFFVLVCIQKTN
jgi:chemotaxis protein CheX